MGYMIIYNLCTDEEITESETAERLKMIWTLIQKNISKYQRIFILRKNKASKFSIENSDNHLKTADSSKVGPIVASEASSTVDAPGSSEKAGTKVTRMSSPISNSIMSDGSVSCQPMILKG